MDTPVNTNADVKPPVNPDSALADVLASQHDLFINAGYQRTAFDASYQQGFQKGAGSSMNPSYYLNWRPVIIRHDMFPTVVRWDVQVIFAPSTKCNLSFSTFDIPDLVAIQATANHIFTASGFPKFWAAVYPQLG